MNAALSVWDMTVQEANTVLWHIEQRGWAYEFQPGETVEDLTHRACGVWFPPKHRGSEPAGKPCDTCGKTLASTRANARFCSNTCRMKLARRAGYGPTPTPVRGHAKTADAAQ